MEYDGDCNFEMDLGTKIGDIPLGIKDIKFKGVMRVELKDLIPIAPLVSGNGTKNFQVKINNAIKINFKTGNMAEKKRNKI